MKCSLCGYEFDEKTAGRACDRCPMVKGCDLVRCPNCGFEMPTEPKWIRWLKDRGRKKDHEHQQPGGGNPGVSVGNDR